MNNKVYGYARVSTPRQNLERQVRNIKNECKDAIVFSEEYTGKTLERPVFTKLLKIVKSGDTIIFDSVSRMSRNAEEGFKLYEELYKRDIRLIFLNERYIDTDVYKKNLKEIGLQMTGTNVDYILQGVNMFMMSLVREQIKLAFIQSEKEVLDLAERTRQGIETARLNGKQVGRKKGACIDTKKSIEAKAIIKKHCIEFGGTLTDGEVIKLAGVNRNTFYKYKRELKAERYRQLVENY